MIEKHWSLRGGANKYFTLKYIYKGTKREKYPFKSLTYRNKQQTEAVLQKSSTKKVLLKISQNSQENICVRVSFLIKLQTSDCKRLQETARDTGVFL